MTAIVPMLNRRNLLAATAGVAITGFPAGRAGATSQYETDLTALRGSISATELGVTGATSSDQSQASAAPLRKAADSHSPACPPPRYCVISNLSLPARVRTAGVPGAT